MEFLSITSAEDYRVEKIFSAYTSTFPADERRDENKFLKLFSNPYCEMISILENAQNVGYLILWNLTNRTFVEHFEVFEEFRSKKYGSGILQHLSQNHPRLILEIEPETLSKDAERRYHFYQKNGFQIIDDTYIQPSYGEGKNPLNLWLMANYNPENIEEIKEEIYDIVYR